MFALLRNADSIYSVDIDDDDDCDVLDSG